MFGYEFKLGRVVAGRLVSVLYKLLLPQCELVRTLESGKIFLWNL